MKILLLPFALIFVFSTAACSSRNTAQSGNLAVDSTNIQTVANGGSLDKLQNQIEQIARTAKGRVGVAATELNSGKTVSLNANEQFPMQSVYKLPIAMAVLQQVDNGKIQLNEPLRIEKNDFLNGSRILAAEKYPNETQFKVGELLQMMVSESDNTATDVLLRRIGGAAVVSKFLNEIKVAEVVVVNTEKEMGQDNAAQYRNWASPNGAIALLAALHTGRGLSKTSQALLMKLLTETQTGAKRLKGLLPAEAVVAHKTGTSGTKNAVTAATNDIGIIRLPNNRQIAVAVFVRDSAADETAREAVIAQISKAICDHLAR